MAKMTKSPAQLQREINEALARQPKLARHQIDLLSRRGRGGELRAGYLTPTGWHGDPMVIEDRKLRLEALREQPAPKLPKEDHATMKGADWQARQMTSGRRVVEKTRGDKIARIFQGENHWTVTISHRDPRGPFETTGEITRQSAKTLAAAKSLGTRLLKGHQVTHATRRQKLPDRYEVVETIDGDWMILIDGVQTGSQRDRSGAGSDTYPTREAAHKAALELAHPSSDRRTSHATKKEVSYGGYIYNMRSAYDRGYLDALKRSAKKESDADYLIGYDAGTRAPYTRR